MNEHTKVILVGNSPEASSVKARLVAMGMDETKVTIQVTHAPYTGSDENSVVMDSNPPDPARAISDLSNAFKRAARFGSAYGDPPLDLDRAAQPQAVAAYPEEFYYFPKKHRGKKRGRNPGAFGKSKP